MAMIAGLSWMGFTVLLAYSHMREIKRIEGKR